MNDQQLLDLHVNLADQTAFTQLVERYVNLAYSAAFSYLGDTDLARDASQLTFMELSRKAGTFSPDDDLSGWIYATARNKARNIIKSETRRRNREANYVADSLGIESSEVDWTQMGPALHDALEQLKSRDREIILLRFFQQKSLAEVGKARGLSGDATRMRIKRALDRLNTMLTKKGITSTATALASALPTYGAISAPVDLGTSISTAILTNTAPFIPSGATLTGAIVTLMKTKILLTAATATILIAGAIRIFNQQTAHDIEPPQRGASAQPVDTVPNSAAGKQDTKLPSAHAQTEVLVDSRQPPPEHRQNDQPSAVRANPPISPEALEKSEAMLEVLLAAIQNNIPVGPEQDQQQEASDLSRKLQVRLELDDTQCDLFSSALSAHAASYEPTDLSSAIPKLLEIDRELVLHCLALEGYGDNLTDEQKRYQLELNDHADDLLAKNASKRNKVKWYDSEHVTRQLNEALEPDQQAELSTYIAELKARENEQRIYKRTNLIAADLGLNEEDRTRLYQHLYQHPESTDEEISALVDPELRTLLQKD